jgi:hypothetical protein
MATNLDERAMALLSALNDLTIYEWIMTPGSEFYAFTLKIDWPDREPFLYHRAIKPAHVNGQPYRTALAFCDEASERLGRYLLLSPEDAQF